MKIVMIGAGNVATVLGRLIQNAGHEVLQVYSRQAAHAALLADQLGCGYTDQVNSIHHDADLYLIAITDNALNDIGECWKFEHRLIVHTAGSVPKNVLMKVSPAYGVLYPLQSLRKENIHLHQDVPLLIDASSDEALETIEKFAFSISSLVERTTDEQRLKLHVAAVLVNNFTNHMYALAAGYCEKTGVNFKLLQPLIEETALRLRDHSPAEMQTGPAVRKDITTLDKHLRELSAYPKLRNIYLKVTDSIMND